MEHRFTFVYEDHQYSHITIIFWSHDTVRDDQKTYNCKVMVHKGKNNDVIFRGVSTFSEGITFQSYWVVEKYSRKLPFRIFIFLVRILHKIDGLRQDDLDFIEANNGCITTKYDLSRKTVTLKLGSILLD
jgi:hypothetical protein